MPQCEPKLSAYTPPEPRPTLQPESLEYVVVHEMLHMIESIHSERFIALMSKHYPVWREARLS